MKEIRYRVIAMFCVAGVLTNCNLLVEPMPKSWNWGAYPRPLTGVATFPPADTDYGQGFKDGCGAAFDAVSKGLLSDINHKGVDPKRLGSNADYSTGWFDGLEQCTYILDWDVT
jgi:hypothetical protein